MPVNPSKAFSAAHTHMWKGGHSPHSLDALGPESFLANELMYLLQIFQAGSDTLAIITLVYN
jgi:hypothetical protein